MIFTHAPIRIYNRAEERCMHITGEVKLAAAHRQFLSSRILGVAFDKGVMFLRGMPVPYENSRRCVLRYFYAGGILPSPICFPRSFPRNLLANTETEAISLESRITRDLFHVIALFYLLRLNDDNS